MKLTLIQAAALHSVWLPEKINGTFYVDYTAAGGVNDRLLSISPYNGNWQIECGINSFIHTRENDGSCKVCILNDHISILSVCIQSLMEDAILLVENVEPEEAMFMKYNVKGTVSIGREAVSTLQLNSGYVPLRAAELISNDDKMTYQEVNAAARTFINGKRVTKASLRPGDTIYLMGYTITVGRNMIAVNHLSSVSVHGGAISEFQDPCRDLTVPQIYFDDVKQENMFYISPRFPQIMEKQEVEISAPPHRNSQGGQPMVLSLGPSFTMGMASAATGAFSILNVMENDGDISQIIPTLVMTSSMLLSSMIWPVISGVYSSAKNRSNERKRKKKYIAYLESTEKRISDIMANEKDYLSEYYPDPSSLKERVECCTPNLWERRVSDPDFLDITLGRGDVESDITINRPNQGFSLEDDVLYKEMCKIADKRYILDNSPVNISLKDTPYIGITGDRQHVVELVRSIVIQLTVLHSYSDVKLVILYDEHEDSIWEPFRWFPHTWNSDMSIRYIASSADELKVVSAGLEKVLNPDEDAPKSDEHYVIISASQQLAAKTDLISHILSHKEYCGFSVIALYGEKRNLPKECGAVIEYNGGQAVVNGVNFHKPVSVVLPQISQDDIITSAVGLANIRLGLNDGGFKLPDMMSFFELYDVNSPAELNCLQRWHENDTVHTLAAPVGVDSRGDKFMINLHQKAHGPHGLIAGTTGSGKSEFIMTYILSMAVNYSPLDISFLLIDYKGGGMANCFPRLPHIAGIITNLDGAAVSRSLISIQSELKRRMSVFNAASEQTGTPVSDIYTYQQLYHEGKVSQPMQHLFIISDEFAELKSQCPDFMDELISAARIGRSLGVHLILATQKPSGVVNDQIWSNSKFKVCLKVQDRADSMDVIKCPDAAALTTTGRFYMQVGYNEIFELGQSAWAGADCETRPDNSKGQNDGITVINNAGQSIGQESNSFIKHAGKSGIRQITAVTDYITALCEHEGISSDKLWLPPIPDTIYADEISEKYHLTYDPYHVTAVIGEYDIPQKQQQNILTLSAQDGNILVYGSAGTGKTTFLVAFIYGIVSHYSPERAVFYILDFASGTLKAFEGYNSVGAVITSTETDAVENLFRYLMNEMELRRSKIAQNGGDYSEYFRSNNDMPAIHLVIANYGAFQETYEMYEDMIATLSRDGSKCGIFLVMTVLTVSGVKYRISQNFSNVFALNLIDEGYSSILSGNNKITPGKSKGRGLCRSDDNIYEFQTAYMTNGNVFDMIRENRDRINSSGAGCAYKIRVLPPEFTVQDAISCTTDIAMPVVALTRSSIEPVCADLHNRITVFIAEHMDNPEIAIGVAESAAHGFRTIMLDARNSITYHGEKYEHYDRSKCADAIRELHAIARDRFDRALERDKQGLTTDYSDETIVCLVYGVGKLMEAVGSDSDCSEKLDNLLLGGSRLDFGIRFILFDNSSSLRAYSITPWFDRHIKPGTYFWIGPGISGEGFFKHRVYNDSKFDFGSDYGYSVANGKHAIVKFVTAGQEM